MERRVNRAVALMAALLISWAAVALAGCGAACRPSGGARERAIVYDRPAG